MAVVVGEAVETTEPAASSGSTSPRGATSSCGATTPRGETAVPEPPSRAASSVTVAVRVRPCSSGAGCLRVTPTTISVSPGKNEQTFCFDHAYDVDAPQAAVWQDLGAPILRAAMEGFNGTIFAYGQTGSGKTHTMLGADGRGPAERGPIDEGAGIIPRLGDELFFCVDRALAAAPEKKFTLTCSFLEIYNEVLGDLLRPRRAVSAGGGVGAGGPPDVASSSPRDQLEIKEHPKLGVHVKGLLEMPINSRADLMRLVAEGAARRATGETAMNLRSSRSHSILTVRISQQDLIQEAVEGAEGGREQRREVWSRLNLVDLAGSERAKKSGAEGSRLKEGIAINQSLSALGQVIIALADVAKAGRAGRQPHVPFRNSKLTRVLQESLGGNSVTVMVANVSADGAQLEETLSTLAYADRAKSIQLRAVKNEAMSEVSRLRQQVEALRQKLASANMLGSGGEGGEEEQAQLATYRSQIEDYEAVRALAAPCHPLTSRVATPSPRRLARARACQPAPHTLVHRPLFRRAAPAPVEGGEGACVRRAHAQGAAAAESPAGAERRAPPRVRSGGSLAPGHLTLQPRVGRRLCGRGIAPAGDARAGGGGARPMRVLPRARVAHAGGGVGRPVARGAVSRRRRP